MNRFPFFVNPYPDELLLSYILRTLTRNGIDIEVFEKLYLGKRLLKIDRFSFDAKQAFWAFYRCLPSEYEVEASELFLSLSTFPFESIFMTPERQMHYINNVFRATDKLNPKIRAPFRTISLCPLCVSEDTDQYGEPYLHRSHQLPGICVCPKHHIRLHIYREYNQETAEFIYSPIDTNLPEEDLNAYADYAQTVFLSGVRSDLKRIKETISWGLKHRGYKTSFPPISIEKLISEWEHRALFDAAIGNGSLTSGSFDLWLSALEKKQPQDILALLMFLFPNPQELIEEITTGRELVHKYTCQSCKTKYYASPLAQETGFGCPKCDEKLSYTERYSHIVQILGKGEYELEEPYVSSNKETKLYHRCCGEEVLIEPRRFIYYGERCLCRRRQQSTD